MKRKLLVLIVFATLVAATACGKKGNDKEVNIAYFDNITHGQALIMKSEETLQKELGEDMKVNWISFDAGPAEVEACYSGDIDIGYIGPVPAVTANVKSDGDFVIISAATNGGAVLIARKDAGITSVKDLEGKRVAIPQLGNTQHLLLLELLESNSLNTVSEGGNVNVVEAENADVANLMDSKEIDAALVPEPWGSTILSKTDSQIILDYDQLNNGEAYSTAVVIVNEEYMEDHEDVVETFLKAHIDATNYIVEYPSEACEIMNKQLDKDTGKSLDESIIEKAVKKIEYTYEIPKDSVMKYSKISTEQKFIANQPDVDIFDSSLLDKVLK